MVQTRSRAPVARSTSPASTRGAKAAPSKKGSSRKGASRASPVKRATRGRSARMPGTLPARIPKLIARGKHTRVQSKGRAGSVEVVKLPVVDVTADVKDDIVVVKPSATQAHVPQQSPVESHEAFTKALTEAPPKRGFFQRLLGK